MSEEIDTTTNASTGTTATNSITNPIIHILVIGFHHKKGCQIEFCYPELEKNPLDNSYILPANWKHLPSLALPDGSHNFDQDSVFFHLLDTSVTVPLLNEQEVEEEKEKVAVAGITTTNLTTVFGISCYRQINASDLVTRDAEVTRTTVQKSVCILSRLPLYGFLKQKLNLITQAYFQQKNFQNVLILKESYHTLNNQLNLQLNLQQNFNSYFIGLNLADLVVKYEHKILILFKLLLLERKVLFYMPATQKCNQLSNTIISLISLLPNQFDATGEYRGGLYKSSNNLNLSYFSNHLIEESLLNNSCSNTKVKSSTTDDNTINKPKVPSDDFDLAKLIHDEEDCHSYFNQSKLDLKNESTGSNEEKKQHDSASASNFPLTPSSANEATSGDLKSKISNVFKFNWITRKDSIDETAGTKGKRLSSSSSAFSFSASEPTSPATVLSIDLLALDFGMPLDLYTNGNVLHPYLSLHYLEYLNSSSGNNYNLEGYTIGATNFLFKQRLSNELDVVVEDAQIDIHRDELKKILQLTTADLRFADYIVKNVLEYRSNGRMMKVNDENTSSNGKNISTSNDDVNTIWEGSDEWIRANFKLYLYSLLGFVVKNRGLISKLSVTGEEADDDAEERSDVSIDSDNMELVEDFNISFVNSFVDTRCYKLWAENNFSRLDRELELNSVTRITHPFNGSLNISDLKLKLMHTFSATESGRKVNKAIVEGSKLVATTGKAVIGGISQAKSSLSSFLSNISNKTSGFNMKK